MRSLFRVTSSVLTASASGAAVSARSMLEGTGKELRDYLYNTLSNILISV